MTAFPTCHTCASPAASCASLAALKASIAGLGLTSVKHRCASYRAAYLPGDPVKVLTLPHYPTDEERVPQRWFPGYFIKLSGVRALVFVKKGAISLDAARFGYDDAFEPNGNGYLKVPLARLAVRDGEAADVTACRWCASSFRLDGHCGRDPNYTPARDCLKAQQEIAA